MKIITNNVPREVLNTWDLTAKEREEFDYVGEDDSGSFARYKVSFWVFPLNMELGISKYMGTKKA